MLVGGGQLPYFLSLFLRDNSIIERALNKTREESITANSMPNKEKKKKKKKKKKTQSSSFFGSMANQWYLDTAYFPNSLAQVMVILEMPPLDAV